MGRRERTKPDMPYHPAPFVRALRACRDTMCDLGSQVKIGGLVYVAAHGITAAIDAMAFLLTGDREYF